MTDAPWLTIVGLGEDGPEGLPPASHNAIAAAQIVMGAARHLSLLPNLAVQSVEWPVPFADGIAKLLSYRGQNVVVLASGDPFWHGAATSITRHLAPNEWRTLPAPSTLSLAAATLGWPLETTKTIGLHAAPITRLRPYLASGQRIIATLRDGDAVAPLAAWLTDLGFGATTLHILEALGGPRQRIRRTTATEFAFDDISHPIMVALDVTQNPAGASPALPLASGRPDAVFDNDGQITKRPVRALTLSALAPTAGEHLWDIGGGSGSIAIEWLWSHPAMQATAVEIDPTRAGRIRANAATLGVDRLQVVTGAAPAALTDLPPPDAVFIGGGISHDMLTALWDLVPVGTRLVANAVTLEAETLLNLWHSDKGGDLMRIELAQSQPLGTKRGWKSAYPIVQWSVVT